MGKTGRKFLYPGTFRASPQDKASKGWIKGPLKVGEEGLLNPCELLLLRDNGFCLFIPEFITELCKRFVLQLIYNLLEVFLQGVRVLGTAEAEYSPEIRSENGRRWPASLKVFFCQIRPFIRINENGNKVFIDIRV
jgi:hypothetical protein